MSKFMKSLCKIAIPVTLQSMLQASFSIVDQIMIGQLGETNISAVGLCGNFSLIFSVVIGAVSTVAGILIAQFIGAEDVYVEILVTHMIAVAAIPAIHSIGLISYSVFTCTMNCITHSLRLFQNQPLLDITIILHPALIMSLAIERAILLMTY